MKKKLLIFLLFFSLYSCKKKPTYCEDPYKVEQIRLVPMGTFRIGNEIIIKNDSLISIITSQICDVKDVNWSTGNRIDGKVVEIQFLPKSKKRIYVVERGYNFNDYRYRENTTYFKNDVLCNLVFKLTEIKNKNNLDTLIIE